MRRSWRRMIGHFTDCDAADLITINNSEIFETTIENSPETEIFLELEFPDAN